MATFRSPRHGPRARGHDGRPHGRARLRSRLRPALLQPDQGLRRIRLPRKPRGELRAPGLRLELAEVPLSRPPSPARCSTRSRWASTPPRRSCAMRASMASTVLPVDVNHSDGIARWRPLCGAAKHGGVGRLDKHIALRLGLRQVDGFPEARRRQAGRRARGARPVSPTSPACATGPGCRPRMSSGSPRPTAFARSALTAAPGAVGGAHPDRRARAAAVRRRHAARRGRRAAPSPALPAMPLSEEVVADYQTQRLSLKAHPMSFLRAGLAERGFVPRLRPAGSRKYRSMVHVAGVVLIRQRPGSAKGVCFITLEDETGVANLVVWPDTYGAVPQGGDGRAADGSARPGRIRRGGDPRDRRAAHRRDARAASAFRTTCSGPRSRTANPRLPPGPSARRADHSEIARFPLEPDPLLWKRHRPTPHRPPDYSTVWVAGWGSGPVPTRFQPR